jgi:hypothetical protein
MTGTARIPDTQVAVARLACGHARVVNRNLGLIASGWRTWCFECAAEVEADYAVC